MVPCRIIIFTFLIFGTSVFGQIYVALKLVAEIIASIVIHTFNLHCDPEMPHPNCRRRLFAKNISWVECFKNVWYFMLFSIRDNFVISIRDIDGYIIRLPWSCSAAIRSPGRIISRWCIQFVEAAGFTMAVWLNVPLYPDMVTKPAAILVAIIILLLFTLSFLLLQLILDAIQPRLYITELRNRYWYRVIVSYFIGIVGIVVIGIFSLEVIKSLGFAKFTFLREFVIILSSLMLFSLLFIKLVIFLEKKIQRSFLYIVH